MNTYLIRWWKPQLFLISSQFQTVNGLHMKLSRINDVNGVTKSISPIMLELKRIAHITISWLRELITPCITHIYTHILLNIILCEIVAYNYVVT